MTSYATLRLKLRLNPGWSTDWVVDDPDLIADLEFTTGQFFSGSLGVITAAQAMTTAWSSGGFVFDADGKLQEIAPDTAPIGNGRGLWNETTETGRITFNDTLSNAAWTKTNITTAQDLPSVYSDNRSAGWRITATADGGTITHTSTRVAAGVTTDQSLPYAMCYWDGTPFTGAVEITQDNFVNVTDIRDQLIANQWVQVYGNPQFLTDLPDPNVSGIRIAKSGDSLGFCFANVGRGYTLTAPVLRAGNGTASRTIAAVSLNTENFPSLAGVEKFTALIVVEPRMYPLPGVGDPDKPRIGWTAMEINNPYIVVGTGIGELTPYGGAGEGSLMTLDSVELGSDFSNGLRMLQGTSGIGAFTEFVGQDTGPPSGAGTYHVNTTLFPYYNGQTTPTDRTLESRLKDAMGYGFNSAIKIEDYAQQIGVTVTVEAVDQSYGFDPQTATFSYNQPNAMGFSFDLTVPQGLSALDGDVEPSNPNLFIAAPVLNADYIISLGSQYVGGVSGTAAPLDGVIQRIIIIGRAMTQAEISAATTALQRHYTS